MAKSTFYSNGKLLITGEYVVLDGAKSLALPTKFGQNLSVEKVDSNQLIHWVSYDHDGSIWFEATIPFSSIIEKIKYDGKLIILDDGSKYESDDEYTSDNWSDGDKVLVVDEEMYKLDDLEKVGVKEDCD